MDRAGACLLPVSTFKYSVSITMLGRVEFFSVTIPLVWLSEGMKPRSSGFKSLTHTKSIMPLAAPKIYEPVCQTQTLIAIKKQINLELDPARWKVSTEVIEHL